MTQKQWDNAIEYVKEKLLEKANTAHQYVNIADVKNLPQLVKYDEWLQSQKGKKKAEGKYKEEWNKWWALWPSTKSVPGTNMKSGAVMKKDEAKMYQKWLEIVEDNKADSWVNIKMLQIAADVYLKWGYYDSIRKGRNELEGRSGMEPWLNQSQYKIYTNMEYPPVPKQQEQHQMIGI